MTVRAAGMRAAIATMAVALVMMVRSPFSLAQRDRQPGSDPAAADLLIVNGRVHAADGRPGFHDALAIRGNRIAAVGRATDLERLRGPATRVLNAEGRAVVPGFNDVHAHILSGGLAMNDVNLQGASTLDAVQERIRAFVQAHPDRAWIAGRGWGYGAFPGNLPTRQQLDAVVPDRPAVMRCFDGHSIWVNSKALALAGITRDTPDPTNGTIVRDPRTGEPTGLLKESPAMALVQRLAPPPTAEERRTAVRNALNEALRYGVTSITDAAGTVEGLQVLADAQRTGHVPARVYYSLLVTPGFSEADADRYDEIRRRHSDSPFLKVGLIKMFLDGVIETHTAFMLAPYTNVASVGTPNYSREEFERIVASLDRRGWQIMVHALGDGAVRMALDAFERVASVNPRPPRPRRHRLEHIETIDLADVPRFSKLGAIASMHPIGAFTPAVRVSTPRPGPALQGAWALNIGPERAARGGMWKSIKDAGGAVAFGSDWPVASLNAMARLTNIVHRAPRPGGTDQRLSWPEAIDAHTRVAAFAAFDEQLKGSLAPGMLADVVVLETDVFSRAPTTVDDVAVYTTIVDGKVVYQRGTR